ncbi:MAG: hypothetical protein ABI574_00810 [Burkholderiales bacterium]
MPRRSKPVPANGHAPAQAAQPVDEPPVLDAEAAVPALGVVSHPDGYYWQAEDGVREFGPFDSIEEALANMLAGDDETLEPGESLQEAEDEIGISTWIDPETGVPAEATSTRIEDH